MCQQKATLKEVISWKGKGNIHQLAESFHSGHQWIPEFPLIGSERAQGTASTCSSHRKAWVLVCLLLSHSAVALWVFVGRVLEGWNVPVPDLEEMLLKWGTQLTLGAMIGFHMIVMFKPTGGFVAVSYEHDWVVFSLLGAGTLTTIWENAGCSCCHWTSSFWENVRIYES